MSLSNKEQENYTQVLLKKNLQAGKTVNLLKIAGIITTEGFSGVFHKSSWPLFKVFL